MRIEPTNNTPQPQQIESVKPKASAPAAAPEQSTVDFAASSQLLEKLQQLPDVRADKIAAAKALVNDPNYPSPAVLEKVADAISAGERIQRPE